MQTDYAFFLHLIRDTVLALPEAAEKPCHGTPGFYAGKKTFARMQEDGEIAKKPSVYFTNDHFRGYDYVLVRLPIVDPHELQALLFEGWKQRATKRAVSAHGQ